MYYLVSIAACLITLGIVKCRKKKEPAYKFFAQRFNETVAHREKRSRNV